jgi:hypothetical protein
MGPPSTTVAGCRRSNRVVGALLSPGRLSGPGLLSVALGLGLIAGRRALPVGLHLNLSAPYTGSDVPEPARLRKARLGGAPPRQMAPTAPLALRPADSQRRR